jgi:cardiolipin synthase
VFVLYDAFGTQSLSGERLAAFRSAGIQAVPFRPLRLATLWRVQNRSHVRAFVIDGRVGWTGGFGIDDKWLGDGHTNRAWRETNVRFTGPAVLQLQAAFAAAWSEATGTLFTGRATVDRDSARSGVTAGLLYAAPTLGSTPAERFLALSIAGARRTLYITNAYFAPDDNFVGLLTRAARRGVDVRLLVGGRRTDIRMTWWAGRARYQRLLAAGVRIYEWQPSTLHAKTFVIDGLWSSIGTMNFDNRSLALNDEVTLMVLDPDVGRRLEAQFVDDLRWATEITAARFAQRPWRERIGEWIADRLTRLL